MITFLVVGRNDGYGINLHKRTAISLNHLASLCEDADDEIIYVDCNTREEDCTLVEAIADTLSPAAKRYLKAYRITKDQMFGAIGETPLPFSDELSRNAGLRRSNPRNRWLLSTNCDVLIHRLISGSLHDLLKKLEPRFYVCPRIGIPAVQWQLLDRMAVRALDIFCDEVIKQGVRLPPEKEQPWLRFGSVGDFQLAPREQWFQIRGCEEGMKLWGHSDANNSRRLNLLNGGGRSPDLGDALRVLHLDQNFSVAASHQNTMPQNDWKTWVEDVDSYLSHNADNWGLAALDLPLIQIRAGDIDPAMVLKTQPRQRNLLSTLRVRISARFWKEASSVANRLERFFAQK